MTLARGFNSTLAILVLSTLTLMPQAAVAEKMRAFSAEYRAYYGSMRGASTVFQLEQGSNGQWYWHSRSEPAGMVSMFRNDVVTERSRFSIQNDEIVPHSYRYHHQQGDDTRRQRRLDFDWNAGQVRFDDDGDRGEMALEKGSMDRFLAQYALMRHLKRGERPERFLIVYRDDSFHQTLEYRGKEEVRTRAGRFETLRVDMNDADSDRSLVTWLAPKLGYLPVKLEQREPGERTVRMELEDTNRR